MQIAISTELLADSTPAALERAAALGFDCVEVALRPAEFDYGYRRKPNARFYRELRQQLDRLSLSVWSARSLPLSQAQMFSARARKDILIQSAAAAGVLGSKVFVVEPADLFLGEEALQAYLQQPKAPPMIDGYDESWTQAVNRRVTMALLNSDYWLGVPLTNQTEQLAKIANDLAIGVALDVRRALSRNTLEAWLAAVGERLAVAYAYDLDAAGRPIAPHSDEWAGWLAALQTTRLKCLVIHPGPAQPDADLLRGREWLMGSLSNADERRF